MKKTEYNSALIEISQKRNINRKKPRRGFFQTSDL